MTNLMIRFKQQFNTLVDSALRKKWSSIDVNNFVGDYRYCRLTYSLDVELRQNAASGGSLTQMLIDGLENNVIDGALVCRTVIIDNKIRPKFYIAQSKEELFNSQGSKYVETRFVKEAIPLIKNFDGRLAVVGLPCDISITKRLMLKDIKLNNKIKVLFALVCGHNSKYDLIDKISEKIESKFNKKIKKYFFRVGHWRGKIKIIFEDDTVQYLPSSYFNDYQNLFFFSEKKCLACYDHYGYDADISVGDIWSYYLKNNPIKHTALIIKNDRGNEYFNKCSTNLYQKKIIIDEILDGQSRIGPFHYNLTARAKVGKLFNIKLVDRVNAKVTFWHLLDSFITLLNFKLSSNSFGKKIIFFIPRKILKFYLYIKKGLESI